MDIGSLLKSDDIKQVLYEFALEYKPKMTSKEFSRYFSLEVRIGASLGYRVGKSLRFRSTTCDKFTFRQSPITSCLALVCSFLANGITLEDISQSSTEDTLIIKGFIPSTALHSGGSITVELSSYMLGSKMLMIIVFPGQLITWGAGKRLIKKLYIEINKAAIRIEQCPSIAALDSG